MSGALVAGGAGRVDGAHLPTPVVDPDVDRILVFDDRGELGQVVREAVAGFLRVPEVVDCHQAQDLGPLLTGSLFDLMVAGPGLDSRAGFERLHVIREELPRMMTLLAVEDLSQHDVRDVVRAGAIDLVELPAGPEELGPPLERALLLAQRTVDPSEPGSAIEPVGQPSGIGRRVITIASASGGCGKTFLATNLAWFLTHHAKRSVCILDLDLQFGEVTASLRLRPRYTITDLIQQSEGADGDMATHFTEFCERHDTGISVLAAPRDPTEAASIRPEDIGRVIDAARLHFDDVIVDTPPALADSVVVAFNRSDELFVMATLDIPSIRNMQVFLGTLERLHVPTDGIRLVLNKAESDAGVEIRQVLKLFPQGFDATLPYAREVQRSINAGRPVLATNPSAEISRQLGDAMSRLLPADARTAYADHEAANRPGRFKRWSRRDRIAS